MKSVKEQEKELKECMFCGKKDTDRWLQKSTNNVCCHTCFCRSEKKAKQDGYEEGFEKGRIAKVYQKCPHCNKIVKLKIKEKAWG